MVIAESKPSGLHVTRILLGGIAATVAMTLFMVLLPLTGLPKMNLGELLGTIFKDNAAWGWTMHVIIGFAFAFIYSLFFVDWLPVENDILRGAMYGIIVFIFSQILLTLINISGFFQWTDKENMALMVFGSALAHMVYGAVLGIFIKKHQ